MAETTRIIFDSAISNLEERFNNIARTISNQNYCLKIQKDTGKEKELEFLSDEKPFNTGNLVLPLNMYKLKIKSDKTDGETRTIKIGPCSPEA